MAVGEFITRDTDLSQPAHQYCNDDPINAVDPSGHDPAWVLWANFSGFLASVFGLKASTATMFITVEDWQYGIYGVATLDDVIVGVAAGPVLLYAGSLAGAIATGYDLGEWFTHTPVGERFTSWWGEEMAQYYPWMEK